MCCNQLLPVAESEADAIVNSEGCISVRTACRFNSRKITLAIIGFVEEWKQKFMLVKFFTFGYAAG
jgi:hypothetical protein